MINKKRETNCETQKVRDEIEAIANKRQELIMRQCNYPLTWFKAEEVSFTVSTNQYKDSIKSRPKIYTIPDRENRNCFGDCQVVLFDENSSCYSSQQDHNSTCFCGEEILELLAPCVSC